MRAAATSAATMPATSATSRPGHPRRRPRRAWRRSTRSRPSAVTSAAAGRTTVSAPTRPSTTGSARRDLIRAGASGRSGPGARRRDRSTATTLAAQSMQSHAQPLIDQGPAGLPVVYTISAGGVRHRRQRRPPAVVGHRPGRAPGRRACATWPPGRRRPPWTDEVSGERRLISSDTGDGLDAVRILLPEVVEHLSRELGGAGRVLVGIPDRHLLTRGIPARRRRGVRGAVRRLRRRAVRRRGRADRSPRLRARRRAPRGLRRGRRGLTSTDGLRVERDGAVVTLTLDRPEALNALTVPLKVALAEALRAVAGDRSVRAVVLTGAGRAFCAGQDLARAERARTRRRWTSSCASTTCRSSAAMRGMDQPVIAAVNGVAAGAGASLAFACDLRLAAPEAPVRPGVRADRAHPGLRGDVVPAAARRGVAGRRDRARRRPRRRGGGGADRARPRVVPADELAATRRGRWRRRLAAGAPRALGWTKHALERGLVDATSRRRSSEEARLQGLAGATRRPRRGAGGLPGEAAAAVRRGA